MRLLHPETLRIISEEEVDFSFATSSKKQIVSHAWSEVFKFLKSNKSHPKMFLNEYRLGIYLAHIWKLSFKTENNFDINVMDKYSESHYEFYSVFYDAIYNDNDSILAEYFDDAYLFSDATSLYFKGVNIFPFIFNDWRKYVPVESLDEIKRQINKTLIKKGGC